MSQYDDALKKAKASTRTKRVFTGFDAWKQEMRRALRIDIGYSEARTDAVMADADSLKLLYINGMTPREVLNKHYTPFFLDEDQVR